MNDFMKDRYGADELTTAMGLLGMVVTLIGSIAGSQAVQGIGLAIVVLALARALSKNAQARRRENDRYLALIAKLPFSMPRGARQGNSATAGRADGAARAKVSADDLKRQARTARRMWKDRKTKAFLKCPTCGATLAVPKGKGRLIVTCPKCHTKMETRS